MPTCFSPGVSSSNSASTYQRCVNCFINARRHFFTFHLQQLNHLLHNIGPHSVIHCLYTGVIICHQPKQCTNFQGKSHEITIHFHCLIPPQNGSHLVTAAIFGTKERGSFTGFAHTSFKCLFPTKANQNGHCLERPKHGARGRSSWKSLKIFFRNMRSICWHIRL